MREGLEVLVPANPFNEENEPGPFNKFDPGTRTLPAGFKTNPWSLALPIEVVLDKDVAVVMRDGVTIYVDVFRPASAETVPVIVAWSPYGKSRGSAPRMVDLLKLLGMDHGALSGLMKFEGPDPAFWCAQGYAVCNPDPRGAFNSEGDIRVFSRREGEDYHDLVEWLGVQAWCNGKVGTTGNSYLSISQWFVAAEQPSHLAAIAPWEGMSDIYRDLIKRGGIPDLPFPRQLSTSFIGRNRREDLVAEIEQHPLLDDLWKTKIPDFANITAPAYLVASYSNSIHTPGTFRGWREMGSTEKWLRIHNTMEWPDYYDEAAQTDLLRFFDHYLKGIDNGWRETPRVRYAVLDLKGNDRVNVTADTFPPEDVVDTRYHLDAAVGTLGMTAPPNAASVSYDATNEDASAAFTLTIDALTEFIGYPKLVLWVAADGADDLDLFVFLQKLDPSGVPLEQFNIPNHGPAMQALTQRGAAILKYKGSNGRLRASMRHLDETKSTDAIPAHSFDRVEKLSPGEIVRIEIDMFPVGLALSPGDQLRLLVSGSHLFGGVMPGVDNVASDNKGRHVIHTGGNYGSYLQVPRRFAAR